VIETWIETLPSFPDQVLPITADLRCPFLSPEKRCAIWEDRPDVCRNFGKEGRACPYVKPDGSPRTPRGTRQMEARRGFSLDEESNVWIRKRIPVPVEGYRVTILQKIMYVKEEVK